MRDIGATYLILVILSVSCGLVAAAAVGAQRKAGRLGLLVTAVVAASVFLVLAHLYWRRAASSDEGSLMAYVLLAIVPTLTAVLLVGWARHRSVEAQWVIGTVGAFTMVLPSVIVGTYFLG